ncbi:globin domain-containing protein [Fulvivirga ligni]|uniref:globin domain-containing protein n=1 Tax=Fulvivirga ligni TaxID=2904246 RepID=UPI001F3BE3CE|nr:globin domain-containing protein [Fulvivirga ligni]UII23986.1 hypothetical protein LVD16_12230 [Fulvivirga ligni]
MELKTDEEKVKQVHDSYGRCLRNGNLVETFYNLFISSSNEVAKKFANTDFEKQQKLLRHGLNLMIMYADGNIVGKSGLSRIQQTHNRHQLDINPKFYPIWKRNLIKAVKQHDPDFNAEIQTSWEQVLDRGIEYISKGY